MEPLLYFACIAIWCQMSLAFIASQISCNSSIIGSTNTIHNQTLYSFINNNHQNAISVNICSSSNSSTANPRNTVHFYDQFGSVLQYIETHNNCQDIPFAVTSNSTYYIGISTDQYGQYTLHMTCDGNHATTNTFSTTSYYTPYPTKSPSTPSPVVYVSAFPTASTPMEDIHTYSCGNYKWCYDVDIHPVPGLSISKTVNIASSDQEENAEFIIQFTAKNYHCTKPALTVIFEEIDFAQQHEYLTIFDNDKIEIATCTGQYDGNCGKWIQCLNEYPLNTDIIDVNNTYNITIFEPYSIDSFCDPIHSYSINLDLILTCSSTSSPTPEPTKSPTHYPSISPTIPTAAPTFTSKVSCGMNEWCYYINLYPEIGDEISETVYIVNIDDSADTYFHIEFTPINTACVHPRFSIIYEDIDFLLDHEYFSVYDTNNQLATCHGNSDYGCGIWLECTNNQSFGIDAIKQDQAYTITIFEPASLDDLCVSRGPDPHSYSINLEFTITCSSNSLSPTSVTIDPTQQPTLSPVSYEPLMEMLNNSAFTASSWYDDGWCDPYNARVSSVDKVALGAHAWCVGDSSNPDGYLQIHWTNAKIVRSVTLYGRKSSGQWVESYYFLYSMDDIVYRNAFHEQGNTIFIGNTDTTTGVETILNESITARYVRIQPITYNSWKSCRVEIYGQNAPPTLSPTNSPTDITSNPSAASAAPTYSPSTAPSAPPTFSPSNAPTMTPIYSSTFSPTFPPTQVI